MAWEWRIWFGNGWVRVSLYSDVNSSAFYYQLMVSFMSDFTA